MKIKRIDPKGRAPAEGPMFRGKVINQLIVGDESPEINLREATFIDGARTNLHTHSSDQILIIAAGKGRVTEEGSEDRIVDAGDVVVFLANTKHTHGAAPGHDMTQLSITRPNKSEIFET